MNTEQVLKRCKKTESRFGDANKDTPPRLDLKTGIFKFTQFKFYISTTPSQCQSLSPPRDVDRFSGKKSNDEKEADVVSEWNMSMLLSNRQEAGGGSLTLDLHTHMC